VTPLYPQKLALTSPTGGGRSVGIVRVRTKATEFSLYIYIYYSHNFNRNYNFNCYAVTVAQLYSCNNNITLKMTGIPAETCWCEHCE